jgi:hypothetical protein
VRKLVKINLFVLLAKQDIAHFSLFMKQQTALYRLSRNSGRVDCEAVDHSQSMPEQSEQFMAECGQPTFAGTTGTESESLV